MLGFALIEPAEFHTIPSQLSLLLNDLTDLPRSMPSIDFSRVEAEWARLRSNVQIPEVWKLNTDGREFKVGEEAKARGLSAEFPVILIPGIISTVRISLLWPKRYMKLTMSVLCETKGLESWSAAPEYREFFRQRVWGGFPMIQQVMFNRDKVRKEYLFTI
jgi:phospholipid:diacylglycerol acyltransferase